MNHHRNWQWATWSTLMSLTLSKVILKYQNNKILTEWIDIKCLSKKLSFLNRYELLPEVTAISTSKAKRLQYIINYAVPLLKKNSEANNLLVNCHIAVVIHVLVNKFLLMYYFILFVKIHALWSVFSSMWKSVTSQVPVFFPHCSSFAY